MRFESLTTLQRLGLAVLSGLLMGLSLPMQWGHWTPPNLGFLAWVALVPLIVAVNGLRPWKAYWISFAGAVVAHTFMVYWIYTALNTFGHLSVGASVFVMTIALGAMSLITAAAPALVCFIEQRRGPTLWAWPLAWAAVEFLRNFGPAGGFTFCTLIHSQYRYPILFQIVNLVGPYWFLAIMVLVNVLFARLVTTGFTRGPNRVNALSILGIFLILLSYGLYSRHHYQTATRHWPWLRVALLQGNIPQEDKWEEALATKNFEVYRAASAEAAPSHPDLIIWPEASYPWTFDLRLDGLPERHRTLGIPTIMGAITREGSRAHNSALLLDESGRVRDVVHKHHLVPYGEYVPYKKYLKFLESLTSVAGDMDPGPGIRPLSLDGMPLGILVCYEDTFPEIARSLVAQGSVLLVNVTNDAWYGWSPAATQHLAASVFRAAENGRYLVRATNTGVSAVIGPDGGVQLASSLYERAVIVAGVRLGVERTLYNRYGWGIDGGLAIVLAIVMAGAVTLGWRKPGRLKPPLR